MQGAQDLLPPIASDTSPRLLTSRTLHSRPPRRLQQLISFANTTWLSASRLAGVLVTALKCLGIFWQCRDVVARSRGDPEANGAAPVGPGHTGPAPAGLSPNLLPAVPSCVIADPASSTKQQMQPLMQILPFPC